MPGKSIRRTRHTLDTVRGMCYSITEIEGCNMQTYLVTYTSPTGKKKQWDVTAPGPACAKLAVARMRNFRGGYDSYTVEPLDKPTGK